MPAKPLHPDQALALVLEAGRAAPLPTETVALSEALGRALPRPVLSSVDHPPFDKAAMDGFAHASSRPAALYRVTELLAAGSAPARPLGPGEAARIMTGAPLPPGADAVQRIEWSEEAGAAADGTAQVRFLKPESVTNVITRGENLRAGELLLGPRLLAAQDLGILASSGFDRVEVSRRPLVGVVSTGDELREPGETLGPASIYDSNGPQLAAQARAAGAEARFYGAFPDREEALRATLGRALGECDLVLVSGGVSLGDFDYVPRVLRELGVETVFHNLAMRPGKPTFFGRQGERAVFGLPGNPVSTFVNFEVLVRPYLMARLGLPWVPRLIRARLAEPLARRGSDRVEFLPAVLEAAPEGELVRPLRYHGSSMLTVLATAEALLRMELGVERIEAGEVVDARLLRA